MSGWSEEEVRTVQEQTGMDRMQAIRHVEGRNILRDKMRRGELPDRRFNPREKENDK